MSMRRPRGWLALSLLIVVMAGCAPRSSEPLYGTWFNKEFVGTITSCKFIYGSDGKLADWAMGRLPSQPYNWESRFAIDREWRDPEGNTWYRVASRGCHAPSSPDAKTMPRYALIEVHADGKVLEGEWDGTTFPSTFGTCCHVVDQRES
jgi:hypothetical protein